MIIRPGGGAGQEVAYAAGRFAEQDDAYIINQPGGASPFGSILTTIGSDYAVEILPDGTGLSWFAGQSLTSPGGFGKACYLRDQESGRVWSAFLLPVNEKHDDYEVTFRPGQVTAFALKSKIASYLTIAAVPGYPCEIWLLRVQNRSARDRTVSLTTYIEPCTGAAQEVKYLAGDRALLMRRPLESLANSGGSASGQDVVLFHSSTLSPVRIACRKADFVGEGRTLRNPRQAEEGEGAVAEGRVEHPVASFTVELDLPIEGEAELAFCFGVAASAERALDMARKFRSGAAARDVIDSSARMWTDLCSTLQVDSPDTSFNALVNTWLPYETYSEWIRARAGSDYLDPRRVADILRRMYPFAATAPDVYRDNLLNFAAGVSLLGAYAPRPEAVVMLPPAELLWLAVCTANYVAETGDRGILSRAVPLADGPTLTLREHCERAVAASLNSGRSVAGSAEDALVEHAAMLWSLVCGEGGDPAEICSRRSRRAAERTEQLERRSLPRRVSYIQSMCPSLSDRRTSAELHHYLGSEDPSQTTADACALYATLTERVLGIRATCEGLIVQPNPPDLWQECQVTRRFGEDTYHINIRRGAPSRRRTSLIADGEPVLGQMIPYFGDGKQHTVDAVTG